MPQVLLVVALTAALVAANLGGEAIGQSPPDAYPAAEIHRPSPVPDRTVLTPSAEPATQQEVTWRTDASVATAQAQIAEAQGGPDFTDGAITVPAETSPPLMADLGYPVVFHTAHFAGLSPDTQYLYRVGDGTNWSEWYEFTTATDGFSPFSFIYYGDAQNDVQEHVSRVFRNAFSDRPEARMIVHAGDLVNVADRDAEWGEWFNAAGWIDGMVNNFATPGNHEYRGGQLSPYCRPQFSFVDNGPQGDTHIHEALEGSVHYADYPRFISLDSNYRTVEGDDRLAWLDIQAAWLDDILTDNDNEWTVVTFHHPVFSTRPGRDNTELRDRWLPVFEKHGVDLVLQGHDHSYARGNLDDGRKARVKDGTVYVVSVSGPKMYELSDDNWTENGAEMRSRLTDNQLYPADRRRGTSTALRGADGDRRVSGRPDDPQARQRPEPHRGGPRAAVSDADPVDPRFTRAGFHRPTDQAR